nr:probable glutathione S-transferase GSTU6 [Aegilops tauschii subsp. strangulata]
MRHHLLALTILGYIDKVYHGIAPFVFPTNPNQRAMPRFWAAYIANKIVAPRWKMFGRKTDKKKDEGREEIFASEETQQRALTECCRGKPFFGGDNVRYVDVILGGMVSTMQPTGELYGRVFHDATKTPLLLVWMMDHFSELDPAKMVLPDIGRLAAFAKMKQAQKALN